MRWEFRECLNKKKLARFPSGPKLVAKEIRAALDDFDDARLGFSHGRFKWATIQAYYAMYHAARALLFSEGYRERNHYCLHVALRELFVGRGRLDIASLDSFEGAMRLRENADYRSDFSAGDASLLIKSSEQFLTKVKRILRDT
jgi:uncharacterized protein (UPF0332 family)